MLRSASLQCRERGIGNQLSRTPGPKPQPTTPLCRYCASCGDSRQCRNSPAVTKTGENESERCDGERKISVKPGVSKPILNRPTRGFAQKVQGGRCPPRQMVDWWAQSNRLIRLSPFEDSPLPARTSCRGIHLPSRPTANVHCQQRRASSSLRERSCGFCRSGRALAFASDSVQRVCPLAVLHAHPQRNRPARSWSRG